MEKENIQSEKPHSLKPETTKKQINPNKKFAKILGDGESIFYKADYHKSVFIYPAIGIIVGILLLIIPIDLHKFFPENFQEKAYKALIYIRSNYLGLAAIAAALGFFAKAKYQSKHHLHLITNYRVIEKIGKSHKKVRSIPLYRIFNAEVKTSILGAITSVGEVEIQNKYLNKKVSIDNISYPKKYFRALKQAKQQFAQESYDAVKEKRYRENKWLR